MTTTLTPELADAITAAREAREAQWTVQYDHVPAPAGATHVHEWQAVHSVTVPTRYFEGTHRGDLIRVDINGSQEGDGSVRERWINVSVADTRANGLDSANIRQGARDMIAAADELDELEGR
ncbi:hypothetical protein A5707_11400 [Mycobacterium kyorinense]|uniref:Uncharacterized protein n=1 Tax=Mycobacterium kyorinense TaxID=487514 RepID=A0A1A2ZWL9_9MYCO|nr:hypothetical protein [Mycobacterium kyorinense]OBI53471.1 hypothetical protein A5707_11400 [Mycobacterium kyorinense]